LFTEFFWKKSIIPAASTQDNPAAGNYAAAPALPWS
jgi:hypothetical protein